MEESVCSSKGFWDHLASPSSGPTEAVYHPGSASFWAPAPPFLHSSRSHQFLTEMGGTPTLWLPIMPTSPSLEVYSELAPRRWVVLSSFLPGARKP